MKFLNITHLLISVFLISSVHLSSGLSSSPNCVHIRNLFNNEGLYVNDKPSGSSQGICRIGKSCCSRGIEQKLLVKSKTEFQQKFRQLINGSIEGLLTEWGRQFNDYYVDAIRFGHKEFDLMFEKLYGPRYKDNIDLFDDFFKYIRLYHEKGEINLEQALNQFFEKLFVRLFKMLNPNFQVQAEFESCMMESYQSVQPFGDIPKNLFIDLKRQLGASRTFVQGFFAAASIINQLIKIDISGSCGTDLMKSNYCSLCSGNLNLKPCKFDCEMAYTKCMVNYQEFETEWNRYLNTIVQFGKRLESTLNLENSLGSINYKISDVIMFFQENKITVSERIFEKCNHIKLRNKRSAEEDEDEEPVYTEHRRTKKQEISKKWRMLASEVKKKMKSVRSYWSRLPKAICRVSNPIEKCWNGTSSIELNKSISEETNKWMQEQIKGIKIKKESTVYCLIDGQKKALSIINDKLISSYNGNGLEKFDFDTQASNLGISTDFGLDENPIEYSDDDDDEEEGNTKDTDYHDTQKPEEGYDKASPDERLIDKQLEESSNTDNKLRSEDEEVSPSIHLHTTHSTLRLYSHFEFYVSLSLFPVSKSVNIFFLYIVSF